MIRVSLISFALVLSHVLAAEAALPVQAKVETQNWIATHMGDATIEGVDVVASFEKILKEIQMPDILASKLQTLVPIQPVQEVQARIVFTARDNNALVNTVALEETWIQHEGNLIQAFIAAEQADLQIVAIPQDDGSVQVSFQRPTEPSLPQIFHLQPLLTTAF